MNEIKGLEVIPSVAFHFKSLICEPTTCTKGALSGGEYPIMVQ